MVLDKAKFRGSIQWKRKRAEILKRDHKKCKICGNKDKGLQVHHIISIDINPMLKLEDSNLITLCDKCHHDVHNAKYNQIYLTKLVNDRNA